MAVYHVSHSSVMGRCVQDFCWVANITITETRQGPPTLQAALVGSTLAVARDGTAKYPHHTVWLWPALQPLHSYTVFATAFVSRCRLQQALPHHQAAGVSRHVLAPAVPCPARPEQPWCSLDQACTGSCSCCVHGRLEQSVYRAPGVLPCRVRLWVVVRPVLPPRPPGARCSPHQTGGQQQPATSASWPWPPCACCGHSCYCCHHHCCCQPRSSSCCCWVCRLCLTSGQHVLAAALWRWDGCCLPCCLRLLHRALGCRHSRAGCSALLLRMQTCCPFS